MSFNMLYDILAPRFAARDENSTPDDICSDITYALNAWFKKYLTGVTCGMYGAVTWPNGTVSVMGTKLTPIMACKPVIDTFMLTNSGVRTALSTTPSPFSSLMTYIASTLTKSVNIWNSPTIPSTAPCIMPLLTAPSFAAMSVTMMNKLKIIPNDSENIPKTIWGIVEDALSDALNAVPSIPAEYIGTFAGGIFTGIVEVNFRSLT